MKTVRIPSRLLALFLALSLAYSLTALPALSEEGAEIGSVTVEIISDNLEPEVIADGFTVKGEPPAVTVVIDQSAVQEGEDASNVGVFMPEGSSVTVEAEGVNIVSEETGVSVSAKGADSSAEVTVGDISAAVGPGIDVKAAEQATVTVDAGSVTVTESTEPVAEEGETVSPAEPLADDTTAGMEEIPVTGVMAEASEGGDASVQVGDVTVTGSGDGPVTGVEVTATSGGSASVTAERVTVSSESENVTGVMAEASEGGDASVQVGDVTVTGSGDGPVTGVEACAESYDSSAAVAAGEITVSGDGEAVTGVQATADGKAGRNEATVQAEAVTVTGSETGTAIAVAAEASNGGTAEATVGSNVSASGGEAVGVHAESSDSGSAAVVVNGAVTSEGANAVGVEADATTGGTTIINAENVGQPDKPVGGTGVEASATGEDSTTTVNVGTGNGDSFQGGDIYATGTGVEASATGGGQTEVNAGNVSASGEGSTGISVSVSEGGTANVTVGKDDASGADAAAEGEATVAGETAASSGVQTENAASAAESTGTDASGTEGSAETPAVKADGTGIDVDNFGGKVNVTVDGDVEAATGIDITLSPAVAIGEVTEGTGAVSGQDNAASEQAENKNQTTKVDVVITGTLSAGEKAVVVDEHVTEDNLSLTVWKIEVAGKAPTENDTLVNPGENNGNEAGTSGTFENTYNTGGVIGSGSSGTVENNYNTGAVSTSESSTSVAADTSIAAEPSAGESKTFTDASIKYIIRVDTNVHNSDGKNAGTLSAKQDAALEKDLATGTAGGETYQYAHENDKVYLKIDVTDDSFEVDKAYGDEGVELELIQDEGSGSYYVVVPKGGGVYLSVTLKDKSQDNNENENNNQNNQNQNHEQNNQNQEQNNQNQNQEQNNQNQNQEQNNQNQEQNNQNQNQEQNNQNQEQNNQNQNQEQNNQNQNQEQNNQNQNQEQNNQNQNQEQNNQNQEQNNQNQNQEQNNQNQNQEQNNQNQQQNQNQEQNNNPIPANVENLIKVSVVSDSGGSNGNGNGVWTYSPNTTDDNLLVQGTVDGETVIKTVDEVVDPLPLGNEFTALLNISDVIFQNSFNIENGEMLYSGIVNFKEAYDNSVEKLIAVPLQNDDYWEDNTYTVVYSDGTVVHAVCTNARVLWIPFPHDAKGLAFVVLKGTVESSQLVKHTILAAETPDSGAGSVTLQFDANQVAGPIVDGIHNEVHVQNTGWTGRARDGEFAGTTGQSRRLEAVRISLTGDASMDGYSVWYRVHAQNTGWLGWTHDSEPAGTAGLAKRAEAIDVQVLPQGQVPRGYDATQQVGGNKPDNTYGAPATHTVDFDALVAAAKKAAQNAQNAQQSAANANAAGTTTEATTAAVNRVDVADNAQQTYSGNAPDESKSPEDAQNARNAQQSAANANTAGTPGATSAAGGDAASGNGDGENSSNQAQSGGSEAGLPSDVEAARLDAGPSLEKYINKDVHQDLSAFDVPLNTEVSPIFTQNTAAAADANATQNADDAANGTQGAPAAQTGGTTGADSFAGGPAEGTFSENDALALLADTINSILENDRNAQRSAANANAAGTTTEATTAAVNRVDVADNAQQTYSGNAPDESKSPEDAQNARNAQQSPANANTAGTPGATSAAGGDAAEAAARGAAEAATPETGAEAATPETGAEGARRADADYGPALDEYINHQDFPTLGISHF